MISDPSELPHTILAEEVVEVLDWSTTALGPKELWPPVYYQILNFIFPSSLPTCLFLGDQYVLLCNSSYRDILGERYPSMFGKNGEIVWAEIWENFAKPLFDGIMETGLGKTFHNMPFKLLRNGYLEECFFDFHLTPIKDENGKVVGIMDAGYENTSQVLSERRMHTLSSLVTIKASHDVLVASQALVNALQDNPDLPFALLYLLDPNRKVANCVASTFHSDIKKDELYPVESINITDDATNNAETWPILDIIKGTSTELHQIHKLPRPQSNCHSAIVMPITILKRGDASVSSQNRGAVVGVIVLGLTCFRVFDQNFLEFCRLVASNVSSVVQHASIFEEDAKIVSEMEKMAVAKTQFFSNVSHEFRTPLTLMIGPLTDLLNEENRLPGDCVALLKIVFENSKRLLKLVNILLDFSRIESDKMSCQFSPIDISELTLQIASSFRSTTDRLGLNLILECPPSNGRKIYVDVDMWEKIVLNLLSNAIKYTMEGFVSIEIGFDDTNVLVRFKDSGVGIGQEHIQQIFQRFYRINNKVGRSYEGTGIGLSLVKELVELHGGTISVESEEGKGSCFTIVLLCGTEHLIGVPNSKIVEEQEEDKSANFSTRNAYTAEVSNWKRNNPPVVALQNTITYNDKNTILVVDDNNDMRSYISNILSPLYNVKTASDGVEALYVLGVPAVNSSPSTKKHLLENDLILSKSTSTITHNIPDLILTDAMMPYLDGLSLVRLIRKNPLLAHVPIIMLSARAGEEHMGLESGADDYLSKPFQTKELLSRVKNIINLSKLREKLSLSEKLNLEYRQTMLMLSEDIRKGVKTLSDLLHNTVNEVKKLFRVNEAYVFESREGSIVITPQPEGEHSLQKMCSYLLDLPSSNILRDNLLSGESSPSNSSSAASSVASSPDSISAFPSMESPTSSGETYPGDLDIILFKEYASMPIRVQGRVWGWIVVPRLSKIVAPTTEEIGERDHQISLFKHIAFQTGVTIHQIELLEDKIIQQQKFNAVRNASIAKSTIIANTSHEIRTPLNAIVGLVEMLKDTPLNAEQYSFVKMVDDAGRILKKTVDDILDFSKLEADADKFSFHEDEFELNDLVSNTIDMFSEMAASKGVELSYAPHNSVPQYVNVVSDPLRLQQVLMNLLHNAWKFTDKGNITISTEVLSTELTPTNTGKIEILFEVMDSGIGILPKDRDSIFESFRQVDGSLTRSHGGTGLGLAISKKIVNLAGGDIIVIDPHTSHSQSGTIFQFKWVFDLVSMKTDAEESAKNKRILIIDNNMRSAESLSLLLHGAIVTIKSQFDIITQIKAHSSDYDVIFLSIALITDVDEFAKIVNDIQNFKCKIIITYLSNTVQKESINNIKMRTKRVSSLVKPIRRSAINLSINHTSSPIPTRHNININDSNNNTKIVENNNNTLQNLTSAISPTAPLTTVSSIDKPRILVVEDNLVNLKVITGQLLKLGHRAEVAENGLIALHKMLNDEQRHFKLILMDCAMPVMDGFQATELIRKIPNGAKIPIVAVTASVMPNEKEHCIRIGMTDIIAKPVTLKHLSKILDTYLVL